MRRRTSRLEGLRDLLPLLLITSPIWWLLVHPVESWIADEVRGTRAVADVQRLAAAADDFRSLDGRWPTLAELVAADGALPAGDPWHRGFALVLAADGSCTVRSAGADGRFDTADDVVSWSVRGSGRFDGVDAATSR